MSAQGALRPYAASSATGCRAPSADLGPRSRRHALAPETPSSARQTNSMIAATKHKIFEMTFSASGSGSTGKANPKTAQTENTRSIPATAYAAYAVTRIEGSNVNSDTVENSARNNGRKRSCRYSI